MKFNINLLGLFALCGGLLLSACTSVNTFPNMRRPGDTFSFMVGGSAQARKENISISLTDAGGQVFDLQALGGCGRYSICVSMGALSVRIIRLIWIAIFPGRSDMSPCRP